MRRTFDRGALDHAFRISLKSLLYIIILALSALACKLTVGPDGPVTDIPPESIDAYIDEAIETLTDPNSCDREVLKNMYSEIEQEAQACRHAFEDDPQLQKECVEDSTSDFLEVVVQRCSATATAAASAAGNESGVVDTDEPDPFGDLVLTTFETTPVNCSQEPEGHFFVLTCDLSTEVEVAYSVGALPTYVFCYTKHTTLSGTASAELTEPTGNAALTIVIKGYRTIYADEDGDGSADAPSENNTNPPVSGDGVFIELHCSLGPSDAGIGAWDSFACLPPDDPERDCPAPWVDLSGAHN